MNKMATLEISTPCVKEDNLQFEVNIDANRLQDLLYDNSIPSVAKKAIQKINKNKKNHNTYLDIYEYKQDTIGRVYSELQLVPKEYRNYLLGDDCVEVDFKNCHFHLLSQVAEKYNVKNDNINYYINNRDECLNMVHQDRNTAKQLYLTAQYGGKMDGIDNDNIKGVVKECNVILTMMKAD